MQFQEQREILCRIGRNMWEKGWVAANDGNLSLLLPDGNLLITPASVSKGLLTPSMLLLIGPDGAVLESDGQHRPSSETALHLRCYRERPDIGAVCHAHPAAATAFACARLAIDRPILGETLMSIGDIPCAPYGRTGTSALPDAAAPLIRTHDAVLLSNHGALTVGRTAAAAYERMETVEHTARIHLYARLLGGGVALDGAEIAALRALQKR